MENFSIERLLGRGAYGQVHLVRRKSDGAELALKRTDFACLGVAEQKATLFEVSLLSRLQHPNIVGFLDHFHENGELCIIMELAPDDLDKELRRARKAQDPIAEGRILDVLSQIGRALHFAHGCRVVHCDVKPSNVLMARDGSMRLADFGISSNLAAGAAQLGRELKQRQLGDGATEVNEHECPDAVSMLQGTPFYMAPELFSDALHVDGLMFSPASDIWALGIMIYELITLGERPYKGESVGTIVYRLLSDLSQNAMTDAAARVQREGGYSSGLCACVEAMLHKRPRQRASLPQVFESAALRNHARGEAEPPLIDLVEEKARMLGGRFPDCYAYGRGAAGPRLRHDLHGVPIIHLACGATHCAAVSDVGTLFTWGENTCGQLGHGDKRTLKTRRAVLFARDDIHCVGAACGRAHTIVLDTCGMLHAFGSDKHGQLGLGRGSDEVDGLRDAMGCVLAPAALKPPPTEGSQTWALITCGERHSAALTGAGWAFAWGCAEDGRLGVPLDDTQRVEDAVVDVPRRVMIGDAPAVMVDCGNEFTALVDDDGCAWGCGANWMGQLGLDPGVEEYPLPVRLLQGVDVGVESVSCGADHMAAIDGSGSLWVWGGRFGDEARKVSLPLSADGEAGEGQGDGGDGEDGESEACCSLVVCGTGTVLAVTDEGLAFTWGDGSCRRLGLEDSGDADHDEPQLLKPLSMPEVRVTMAAIGKGGSAELDEAPAALVLAVPEGGEQLSDQYARFYAGHFGSRLEM